MSKTLYQFRTAFVGFIVLLQLILLPATHVLHLGCQHAHGDGLANTVSVFDSVEGMWAWCWSSHCCDHCSATAKSVDDQPAGSGPIQPAHDENSCPVCQAVFAARIATVATVDLATTEPVCEFVADDSQAAYSTPLCDVLSRGPPSAVVG
ncbi:MAG: hypothetical protein WAO83_26235 [Fuerstiella sp.]